MFIIPLSFHYIVCLGLNGKNKGHVNVYYTFARNHYITRQILEFTLTDVLKNT